MVGKVGSRGGSDGKTRGKYGFRTPDGCMHVVSFEADQAGGYRVLGTTKEDCTFDTSRHPVFNGTTARRPLSVPRLPVTSTTQPQTFNTRPDTTTTRVSATPTTTTTTTFRSAAVVTSPTVKDPLSVPGIPVVDNTITEDSQGRQLRPPTRPSPGIVFTTEPIPTIIPAITTTTPKPEKKPEPLYSFGFTTPTHGHTETGLPDGSKKGEYFWDTPEGWRYIVTYEANARGFYPKIRRLRTPTATTTTTTTTEAPTDSQGRSNPNGRGKVLELGPPSNAASSGCPYFFYYNTRINYHWEHCYLNNTKVGEFGSLGSDGYAVKNAYYADLTGFHPTLTRTPLTPLQQKTMAEYSAGVFIVPKPDEERRETEKRILAWLEENRDQLQNPLR
nr:uncharacterized protein DDB_G0290587-like [Cherax quadricarinatus]